MEKALATFYNKEKAEKWTNELNKLWDLFRRELWGGSMMLKVTKPKEQTGWHTKQNCRVCGKTIKIEALDFLMNLDKPVICDKCKKLKRRWEDES